jgi:molecular chaperone GrpE
LSVPEEKKEKKVKKKKPKEVDILKAKIKLMETELVEEKDKRIRSYAELENFKKRKEQEKVEFCKYANEKFIMEFMPVLDSFDRAVEHYEKEHKGKAQKDQDGFLLIQKQFHNILVKMGVNKIEAIGKQFDPNLHQAIFQEAKKDVEENTILKEVQAGYKLHEKVIRPTMVVVSKKA